MDAGRIAPATGRIAPATGRIARAAVAAVGLSLLVAPAPVAAHELIGRYESPLPLAAYLGGAAVAVALSFALVLSRAGPSGARPAAARPRTVVVPAAVRVALRGIGLLGWAWIVLQAIVGGSSGTDAGSLFLWNFGWVGIALTSALAFPVWRWIDPFTSLHDLGGAALRRLGVTGWRTSEYPAWLAGWPAVGAFAVVVWLELAVPAARTGGLLATFLLAYTAVTLLGMAQFGRDVWRSNGEAFTAWFGTLGRLAPLAEVPGAPDGMLERRGFASGLGAGNWPASRLVLVALGVGSVIFDGLSQTEPFFDAFGQPSMPAMTAILAVFLAAIVALVLAARAIVGGRALGAGLVPIATGYVAAHYLTFLLFDGQRLVALLSDPLRQGWDILSVGEFEPATGWLAPAAAWAMQLGSVVAGHVLGAKAGHDAALGDGRATGSATIRRRQVPLAVLMVGLTTLTLWSLGQNIVKEQPTEEESAQVPGPALVRAALGFDRGASP